MRKNIFIKTSMVILTMALLVGCSRAEDVKEATDQMPRVEDNMEDTQQKDTEGELIELKDEKPVVDPVNQGITVNFIDFEIVDISTLSEQLQNDIENRKLSKGYEYWEQENGAYLILISAGEKSTGGYGIKVEAMEDNEGKTIISVVETEPAEGDMNIQVITYPYVVLKASGITDQFVIRDQNQEEYTRIVADAIEPEDTLSDDLAGTMLRLDESAFNYNEPIVGIYQGQMDNHTIEVLVGDVYMPFSADEIDQYLKGIELGDKVEITVEISPSDQIIVTGIKKVVE